MKPKRIGLLGTSNVGKDTLSHHLFTYLKMKGKTCYYIPEIAEQAIMRGIDLKDMSGQMWMLGEQVKQEMSALTWGKREFIICNRTVIDCIPYSKFMIGRYELEEMVTNYISLYPYDLIFWLRPLPEFVKDGVRWETREDQLEIDRRFGMALAKYVGYEMNIKVINARTKESRKSEMEPAIDELLQA